MRRIALRKLWDESTQKVSFSKLSEIALELYLSSGSMATQQLSVDSENASVTVTYTDEDGDIITISTDDELVEAFEQFVNKQPPVLRANASVTAKKVKVPIAVPARLRSKASVSKMGKRTPIASKRVKGSSTKSTTPADELQNVIENFVGVLTVAVNTLTKNVPEDLTSKVDEVIDMEFKEPKKSESKKDESTGEKNQSKKAQDEKPASSDNTGVPSRFDRNFIHGRHTCDSCLVTPIIGIRYNATNLPDYDLCQKCIPNYKGSHIKFAPAQLERDVQLQPRWKRRHARFVRQAELNQPSRPVRRTMPTSSSGNGPCSLNIASDADLKEAIRRSLRDANQKRVTPTDIPQNTVKETDIKQEEKKEPEIPVTSESLPVNSEATQSEVNEVIQKSVEANKRDDISEESKTEEVQDEVVVEDIATDDVPDSKSEGDVKDMNLDNESLSFNTSFEDIVVESNEKETDLTITSTFSKDAEGSGDVAAAIGHALDNCAEVIDAMMEEANKTPSTGSKESNEAGQTIIEGSPDDVKKENGDDAKTEISEDSEWQVLESVASDEMIAQAAQLLGSALFQSDIVDSSNTDKDAPLEKSQTSASNVSSMTIPTSEISSVVLSRWDNELKQLHELGFLDDHSSVEALEHLEAASMGCDGDAVTVNDAVNYMLKQVK